MPEIRRLPETLVNRIAAGEVVERPAAALKELVENAVDAGATRIAVTLVDGGLTQIEVTDDGCGMDPETMELALERHATSKLPESLIGEGQAIERVATLGFRGEALPSIASVARFTLESRPQGSNQGWRRVVDHGDLVEEGPAALPQGTRARVEQVFAKAPARRKFLRTARSEYGACLDIVRRLAMARPDIGFTLHHRTAKGDRQVLALQSDDALPDRVAQVVARELKDNAVLLDMEREAPSGTMRLTGIAGLPTYNRGVADHQYLFVNGRPVKDRLLVGAVRGAYSDMLARDRHAVLALFLDLPSEDVDVNGSRNRCAKSLRLRCDRFSRAGTGAVREQAYANLRSPGAPITQVQRMRHRRWGGQRKLRLYLKMQITPSALRVGRLRTPIS